MNYRNFIATVAIAIVVASAANAGQSNRDAASIPASDVLQLCAAHAIKDVVCDEARQLELKYHNPPCWETNKC